jgi:hypothetical protein
MTLLIDHPTMALGKFAELAMYGRFRSRASEEGSQMHRAE